MTTRSSVGTSSLQHTAGVSGKDHVRTAFETGHRWLSGDALFRGVERSDERSAGWR
jgi:hypothetical protein